MDVDMVQQKPAKEPLSRIPRVRGEFRAVILSHAQGRAAARIVRVEAGGVDRQTGEPLKVFFEVTAKAPWRPEVTRTFSQEYNAHVAYLMAQHGVADFTTALGEVPPRLWPEPRNLTALARLERPEMASRTRINSGDSDAEIAGSWGAKGVIAPRAAGTPSLLDSGRPACHLVTGKSGSPPGGGDAATGSRTTLDTYPEVRLP